MQKLINKVKALEEANDTGMKVTYIGTIAPLNWQDVVAVRIEPGSVIRFVTQIFREGTEHIPQKTYDKLGEEEQIEADKYLDALQDEALKKEAEHA